MVPRTEWSSISFCGAELNYIHSLNLIRLKLINKQNYIAFETEGPYYLD